MGTAVSATSCHAEAQHVILTEPLLDPAVEAQAVGRVHRIGQTHVTYVHRYILQLTGLCLCSALAVEH